MLRLWLLRHAKSGWDNPDLDDFARKLAPRGKKACKVIGHHLASRDIRPDLVLCSPATRTRDTWTRIAEHLSAQPGHRFDPVLYLASAKMLLAMIRAIPDETRELMLIGHNPGLEELAAMLSGSSSAGALDRLIAKYPTGALAELHFPVSHWAEVRPKTGFLASFVTPAMLEDAAL